MTKEQFCELLRKELGEESKITPETNFKELSSFGSLTSILVLQLIENELGAVLNPRSFRSIKTVNDIADVVSPEVLN